MTHEDNILLESYFSYKNMEEIDRNFYINLLLSTKDISDSDKNINSIHSKFDLLFLNLSKNGEIVNFDGAVYNNIENRLINGFIIRKGNNYFIKTNVYRCSDYILDEDKEYSVEDIFFFYGDKVERKSRYDDSRYETQEIDFKDAVEIDEYLENKVKKLKLK